MDDEIKTIFKVVGLEINQFEDLNGMIISRETLLSDNKYDELKYLIPELKKNYSSSFMTSLQKNAEKSQKWPLLNLIRQILHVYGYNMEPIRKADGYTLEGVKKYKRYFLIHKKNINNEIKKIELNNFDDNKDIIINKENEF
jgi:hypothetical protein